MSISAINQTLMVLTLGLISLHEERPATSDTSGQMPDGA